MQKFDGFGTDLCQSLLQRKISIGMTTEMVKLSWGKPNNVDNREITY